MRKSVYKFVRSPFFNFNANHTVYIDYDNTDAKSTLRKLAHPHTGNKTYQYRRHNIIQAFMQNVLTKQMCVYIIDIYISCVPIRQNILFEILNEYLPTYCLQKDRINTYLLLWCINFGSSVLVFYDDTKDALALEQTRVRRAIKRVYFSVLLVFDYNSANAL